MISRSSMRLGGNFDGFLNMSWDNSYGPMVKSIHAFFWGEVLRSPYLLRMNEAKPFHNWNCDSTLNYFHTMIFHPCGPCDCFSIHFPSDHHSSGSFLRLGSFASTVGGFGTTAALTPSRTRVRPAHSPNSPSFHGASESQRPADVDADFPAISHSELRWSFEKSIQGNHQWRPIGSMVLVYMLTLGVYWWDPCYHI